MKKIEVFIIIDVSATLASGHIQSNVCIVDTNRWIGSWSDDASTLHTVCLDRQSIGWRAQPVSLDDDVIIKGFGGQMVASRICYPAKDGLRDGYWQGQVQTRGATGRYEYDVIVSLSGREFTFRSYINVN